jgi:predicted NAD/FAD-dependent oxidoreductase
MLTPCDDNGDDDDDADHQPMMDRVVGGAVGEPSYVGTAFRWRFAIPANPLPERFVYDDALRIGLCGDWVGGPRVEVRHTTPPISR